jgi:hypothetical protein
VAENETGSIRDAMEQAYSKATTEPPAASDAPPADPAPAGDGPVASSSAGSEPPAAPSGRERDEHGRFKAKDTAAPTEGGAETAGASAQPQAPTTDKPETAPQAKDPTASWSAADREAFKSWPEAAQLQFLRRYKEMEAGVTRKFQEVAHLRDFEPVAELFRPYEAQLKMQGLKASDVINQWASAEAALRQDPASALKQLGRMYGVDVQIGGQGGTQPANSPVNVPLDGQNPSWIAGDPEHQRLRQEVDYLKQLQQQQERTHFQGQVNAFASAKGVDGKLAHPYFEQVRTRMGAAIASLPEGAVPDLEALYQEAIWAHPEVREELLAAQRDAAKREQERQAREKAAAAARAGVSIGSGAPIPGQDGPAPQSLRKTLEEAWNRTAAR